VLKSRRFPFNAIVSCPECGVCELAGLSRLPGGMLVYATTSY
jgi:hypothetical protein